MQFSFQSRRMNEIRIKRIQEIPRMVVEEEKAVEIDVNANIITVNGKINKCVYLFVCLPHCR